MSKRKIESSKSKNVEDIITKNTKDCILNQKIDCKSNENKTKINSDNKIAKCKFKKNSKLFINIKTLKGCSNPIKLSKSNIITTFDKKNINLIRKMTNKTKYIDIGFDCNDIKIDKKVKERSLDEILELKKKNQKYKRF